MPKATVPQPVEGSSTPFTKPAKPAKDYSNLNLAVEALNCKCVFLVKSAEIAVIPTPAHPELDIYSVAKFKHVFDKRIDGKSLTDEWMIHPNRRNVYKVTYVPAGPQFIDGNINTWVPSPIKPKQGNISRFLAYIDHMFKSDPTHKDWFIAWTAYQFQFPGVKLNTASIFWSKQTGNGKTTYGLAMRHLHGMHNSSKIGQKNLTEIHNTWAQRKTFVFGEEIRSGTSDKDADEIKGMITGDTIYINPKHVQQYEIPDTINYYFASNHDHAFYLDSEDRRFFVHEVTEDKGSKKFWDDFYSYLDNGGYEAILYYLLNEVDLSKPILHEIGEPLRPFSPTSAAPQSKARKAMIEAVHDEADEWIKDLIDSPEHVLQIQSPSLATSDTLFEAFIAHHSHARIKCASFTSKLNTALPRLYNGNPIRLSNGTRKRVYVLAGTPGEWETAGSTAIQVALAQTSGENGVPPLCHPKSIN